MLFRRRRNDTLKISPPLKCKALSHSNSDTPYKAATM